MSFLARVKTGLRSRLVLGGLLLVLMLALAGYALHPTVTYQLAKRALTQNRPRDTLAWIGPALAAWPDDPELHLLTGKAARLVGDYEMAERHLIRCQRLEEKPSEARLLEWALFKAETGDLKSVESFLREQVKRQPEQGAPIGEALAVGYLRVYRLTDALAALETALRQNPDSARALALRGRAYERVHAYGRAADDYERAATLDPDNDDHPLRHAKARLENGEPARAVVPLEKLRRLKPVNAEVLIRLAFAYNALGRLDEAIVLVDEILLREPELPLALSARGQLAFQEERLPEAEAWLTRAVAATPFDRQALYVLQQCLEQQGKTEAAAATKKRLKEVEDLLERLIAISNRLMPQSPRDPALHHELGTILQKMGHAELARTWLHSALEQDPSYRPAHEALARYYAEAGESLRASQHQRAAETGTAVP